MSDAMTDGARQTKRALEEYRKKEQNNLAILLNPCNHCRIVDACRDAHDDDERPPCSHTRAPAAQGRIDAWVIKAPNGNILINSISGSEITAKYEFCDDNIGRWEHYYKEGYRCVPIALLQAGGPK